MPVVMLDFDGVLFDTKYRLNVNPVEFRDLIDNVNKGYTLVPNSDTPVQRLKSYAINYMGFRPNFMIGERGAVVVADDSKVYTSDIHGIPDFQKRLLDAFTFYDCMTFGGDSATTLMLFDVFAPNQRLLFVDKIREQSVNYYARVSDKGGKSYIDLSWLDEVKRKVDEIPLPDGLLPFDHNKQYGIAIANAAKITKATGYREIKKAFPDETFYMIGDSMSDHLQDGAIIQCAVGNASHEYKSHCHFVSEKPYTQGLTEILKWILQN